MTELHDDLMARMRPSDTTVAAAIAYLDEHPDVDGVWTPIWFPRKEYGFWTADQQVEDAAIICTDRDMAGEEAAALMGEQPGTVGYVWHRRDGWAVFEDILPPTRLIQYREARRNG